MTKHGRSNGRQVAGVNAEGAGSCLPVSAFNDDEFRHVLGHFATGVTVVTTLDRENRLCGFTASSFTSVSLDPPLVLICVSYATRAYRNLLGQRAFTIHILKGDQGQVARAFASPGGDRSEACSWRASETGLPLLSRFHAAMECTLFREFEGGDHAIVVAQVERLYIDNEGDRPLMWYRGSLFPLNAGDQSRQAARTGD